jgi:class 3 adenylate cyclase
MNNWRRLFRLSSWPIAGKLAFAFVFTALIPIFLTASYGLRETLSGVASNEERNLAQLAVNTAGRLDQLLAGTRRALKLLQAENREHPFTVSDANANALQSLVRDLRASNDDFELVMLLDQSGHVRVASSPDYPGKDFSWRRYFKEARQGHDFVSSIELGSNTGRPGVYLSAPLRDAHGDVIGVAVIKVVESSVSFIMAQARSRPSLTPFIIDEYGIVIHHPDPRALHKSLGPLTDAERASVIAERRYGSSPIESLGQTALAARLRGANTPGNTEFTSPQTGNTEVVGFAPLQSHGWVVAVAEAKDVWESPLRDVYNGVIGKVLLVALIAALFAIVFFTRDILRPVRELTDSALAVNQGRFAAATANVMNEDEIGQLAQTFNTMVQSIIDREKERDIFGRMVSPEVREKLLKGELKLGGENRRVSVLFSDIRDFTAISEGMAPEAVVEFVNEYLSEMTAAVQPHFGYVNNFLGDAIIVVFGAPYDHPDSPWGAVQAAFDMRERLEALNEVRRLRGQNAIRSGIGISTGVVVAGQMGSLERFMYTVIGDAVNVASRLETLTKEFDDNPILVNAETADAVRYQSDVEITALGERVLRGRKQPIQLYSVAKKK